MDKYRQEENEELRCIVMSILRDDSGNALCPMEEMDVDYSYCEDCIMQTLCERVKVLGWD